MWQGILWVSGCIYPQIPDRPRGNANNLHDVSTTSPPNILKSPLTPFTKARKPSTISQHQLTTHSKLKTNPHSPHNNSTGQSHNLPSSKSKTHQRATTNARRFLFFLNNPQFLFGNSRRRARQSSTSSRSTGSSREIQGQYGEIGSKITGSKGKDEEWGFGGGECWREGDQEGRWGSWS